MRHLELLDLHKARKVHFDFKRVSWVHFQTFFWISAPRFIWVAPFWSTRLQWYECIYERGYFKDNHDGSQRTLPLCGYLSCFVFDTSEVQISARSPAVMTVGLLSCYEMCLYHRHTLHFLLHVALHCILLVHISIITVILRDVKRVLRVQTFRWKT